MTILLVEHDMDFVMGLTDRLVVMEFGEKLAEGTPAEIQRDPRCSRPTSAASETAAAPASGDVARSPDVLDVERLSVAYGKVYAVRDVSLHVAPARSSP